MSIVNSQLKNFSTSNKGLSKINPFIPSSPFGILAPTGYRKLHLTTNDTQDFGSTLKFTLPKNDFLLEMYAVVSVLYEPFPHNSTFPLGVAMAAIKNVKISTAQNSIYNYDYKTLMSHIMDIKGTSWQRMMQFNADIDLAPDNQAILGGALLFSPWSQAILRNESAPPFPSFLVGGPIDLELQLESVDHLTVDNTATGAVPTEISVSVVVRAIDTTADIRADLRALPSYTIFSRDFQTFTNFDLSVQPTTLNLNNYFVGTMRAFIVKCQLLEAGSTTKPVGTNWWDMEPFYDIQVTLGGQLIYQSFTNNAVEQNMDVSINSLSGSDYIVYPYVGVSIFSGNGYTAFTLLLNGVATESLIWAGGANMTEIGDLTVEVIRTDGDICNIMGEMDSRFVIEKGSFRKLL